MWVLYKFIKNSKKFTSSFKFDTNTTDVKLSNPSCGNCRPAIVWFKRAALFAAADPEFPFATAAAAAAVAKFPPRLVKNGFKLFCAETAERASKFFVVIFVDFRVFTSML